jgi:hypothetical protein
MTRRDHLHAVSSWLNDLNELTAGSKPLADSKPKIASLAAALGEEFPPGAFTRQSLLVVARANKFFPSYAEICELLSPWWKDRRPTPIAIETDQSSSVKQRELERRNREEWEGVTAAQVRGHIRDLASFSPTDMAIAHRGILAHGLAKNAPQHLGLLPPEWLQGVTEPAVRAKIREASLRAAAAETHAEVKRGKPE